MKDYDKINSLTTEAGMLAKAELVSMNVQPQNPQSADKNPAIAGFS
ncbi:MAG: hypothetical protein IJ551_06705 [Prevotella sp.]|nr:hypothetical protein [Prevotella sp.]